MDMKLFEDDDDAAQNEDVSKIEVNEEYARRLEYNRKRQDLQRYEELKKKGLINDSDESEESEPEEDFADSKKNLKFFEALNKVKKQDPSLKNKDVKLFESDGEAEVGSDEESQNKNENGKNDNNNNNNNTKKKKMYLKDVQAKHLVEEGPEFGDDEEEDEKPKKKHIKTYDEEQEELRKKFLDAVEEVEGEGDGDGDGDGEDFLRVKEKHSLEDDGENKDFVEKLDEYFGGDTELDENEKFLKDFFMKKLWLDKDDKGKRALVDEDEIEDLDKDEEEIERQEEYETNYRYEENAGERVMGHSRKVEGSVRKKENARKEQRKSKEERMRIAEMERKEELKYLKNLKKKEIKERMQKVLAIAGLKEGEECPIDVKDLDDDFDPEEYDRMMKAAFDENYYDAEDSSFGSDEDGDEKPDFEMEDELLGLPKNWDVIKPGEGFLTAREKSLKDGVEGEVEENNNSSDVDVNEFGEDEKGEEQQKEEIEESKRKRKRKASLVQRAKEALMEEYYKLDYEDTIGDLRTRFKYAEVKPNRYGLSAEELLGVDEKELNQYVSLKKIAPYRENEWKVPNSKRHQQKLKNKELLRKKVDHHRNEKKKKRKSMNDSEKPTSEILSKDDQKIGEKKKSRDRVDKLNVATAEKGEHKSDNGGNTDNLSRKAKRRRRQSELKLPHSRLLAYGKI